MRKLFVLVVLVFIGFVAVNRQRIFLRDPLGKMYRNAVPVENARIFINFSNDVLVEETTDQRMMIVQNWNKIPGTPKALTCMNGMACWADADHADLQDHAHHTGSGIGDRRIECRRCGPVDRRQ